ncbi:hypothetical protein [Cellulomonas hominis]|uniref:hypothetical protein n=1 Tax=Cellulomonas hominis TaxID=156981 RepID=UPI001BA2587B|nr:hypothetical protein [Cellulomonas hominis]VTR76650.1 hypothetical protein CHMI_01412 [Cellulomonas hominis]
MSDESTPPLLGLTAHDPAWDRHLRAQVSILRDRARGTELAALLDDVLAGRRTLREVARTPAFDEAVRPAVQRMATEWDSLSEAERDELARQAAERIPQAEGQRRI